MSIAIMVSVTCMQSVFAATWENPLSHYDLKKLKSLVKKSVQKEFENPDDDWKNLIRGKSIKSGAISERHLDAGVLPETSVHTLSMECAEDFADKTEVDYLGTDIEYYKQFPGVEIDMDNPPMISLCYKVYASDSADETWSNNGWRNGGTSRIYLQDGGAWINYGEKETGESIECSRVSEYRMVLMR